MGQYGYIYLVMGTKKYNFDDIDIIGVKGCFKAIKDLELDSFVKERHFQGSSLLRDLKYYGNYIMELDKKKWLDFYNSTHGYGDTKDYAGVILYAYAKIPESRILFNDEYCYGRKGTKWRINK